MKKLINSVSQIVSEQCHGIALACPSVSWDQKYQFIKRSRPAKEKVRLISGGGSGHEPAHAGYVGFGLLDAAVCGNVFSSPSQIQVYKAIKDTASPAGTLLIIKNYSGDMMNFKNAAYMAQDDGLLVDYVKVDDDIAVQDSLYTVGRRGVAGTLFVHKIAGAAAERGYDLQKVKAIAEKTVRCTKTLGFAFSSCTVPANGSPTFHLQDSEFEYGIGIHGEPGIRRETIISADELADRIVNALLDELGGSFFGYALLVNGMGGTPLSELYILNHSVRSVLQQKNCKIRFSLVGNYMTSLEMQGASLTLLKLDEELFSLLSDPCDAPALRYNGEATCTDYFPINSVMDSKIQEYAADPDSAQIDGSFSLKNMFSAIQAMASCILTNEQYFCELDSFAGDGDFGMSIAAGFRKLTEQYVALTENAADIGSFLEECSYILMEYCGGSSGPLWGSAFRAAGKSTKSKCVLSSTDMAEMFQAVVSAIQITGERTFGRGAVVGDKTLIDALIPYADAWSQLASSDKTIAEIGYEAARAAVEGAESTAEIAASMGRAANVGDRSIGYPDAGAFALGVIFSDLAYHFQEKKF